MDAPVFHQVGNLGLLFMLLFFIYAALGVELFGELGESCASSKGASRSRPLNVSRPLPVCNADYPCEGMSRHATFENFGMAFLTLFQVSTGDNWNGIMKVPPACSQTSRQPGFYLILSVFSE